jgi:hypothetical protein
LREIADNHSLNDLYAWTQPPAEFSRSCYWGVGPKLPSQAIAAIEAMFRADGDPEEVPSSLLAFLREVYQFYKTRWRFDNPFQEITFFPPISTTNFEVDEHASIWWSDFALSFVHASIRCESPAELQKIPPTLDGLAYFVPQTVSGNVFSYCLDREVSRSRR